MEIKIIRWLMENNRKAIQDEIADIFNKPCYSQWNCHALFTYNGDSQRYWKLTGILERWF